jgi:glycopeptide antibiotics resistance protein
MKYRVLLFMYLAFLVVVMVVVVPLGGLNTTLTDTFLFQLRLDYLVHAVVFAPLVVLWRLSFTRHPLWLIILTGLALAVGLEGVQFLLPYRAWNVNDAVGNAVGVVMGCALVGGVRLGLLAYCR